MLTGLKHSKYEEEIWVILNSLNIKFERWSQVEEKNYDILIPKYNLLIEFNGDFFHCNPKIYDKNFFNKVKKKTANQIWKYDNNKVYLAKKNNYNLEIIWESDYNSDDKIIYKIINKYEKKYKCPRSED
jgi:G:T-mismatch repair DNA endonuclease (very short patch repair protein)